jgi:uncharacterized protein YxeA
MNAKQAGIAKDIALVILVLIIALSGYIAWNITPNLKGYCKRKYRYLTDEEKIDIAIEYIMDGYPPVIDILERQGEDIVRVDVNQPKNPIYYDSIEEFKIINKECCQLTEEDGSGYQVSFFTRARGDFSTYVRVRYKVRYINSENELSEEKKERFVAITNCGTAWLGW